MNYERIAVGSQLVSSILFAVIIIVLFQKYLLPAIARVQQQKNHEIERTERERDEASAEVGRAEAEVARARGDAEQIRVEARAFAQRERDRIVREATEAAALTVHNAEGELSRSRATATLDFRARLVARALEIARDSARSSLDIAADRRLISEVARAPRTEKVAL